MNEKIETDIKELKTDIKELKTDIKELKTELVRMNNLLQTLVIINEKMSSHIDFVNSAYSAVKSPLNFLKYKIEMLTGVESTTRELPDTPS